MVRPRRIQDAAEMGACVFQKTEAGVVTEWGRCLKKNVAVAITSHGYDEPPDLSVAFQATALDSLSLV